VSKNARRLTPRSSKVSIRSNIASSEDIDSVFVVNVKAPFILVWVGPGVVAQRTRRWISVIVTSGSPIFEGSRPLATATLPMAGMSVDWTNCS
jgi:hypothetical protein